MSDGGRQTYNLTVKSFHYSLNGVPHAWPTIPWPGGCLCACKAIEDSIGYIEPKARQ